MDVIEVLSELFITRGLPKHIRSDNGPEFTSKAIQKWLNNLEVGPLFIQPGSPWENGYNESFNRWRVHYNTKRPYTSLGYRPPAPEVIMLLKVNVEK